MRFLSASEGGAFRYPLNQQQKPWLLHEGSDSEEMCEDEVAAAKKEGW